VHREAVAQGVVVGDSCVHLHLVLAHLGAIVGGLAHQSGLGEAVGDAAQLEQHIALEVTRLLVVDLHGVRRQCGLRREVSRQLAHLHLDEAHGLLRGHLVDGGHRRHRLALVAHLVAGKRMLATRDRQYAKRSGAVRAGDNRQHARHLGGLRGVDLEDLRVRIGAAVDAPSQHLRLDEIGRVLGATRDLLGPVHHGHVAADVVDARDLVHGLTASPVESRCEACCTASMIFT
jgi:hypothetical protein